MNGYENIINNGRMVCDVNYWINYYLSEKHDDKYKMACINTSVEESTLRDRNDKLLD